MGLGDQISRIIIDVKAETKSARTQLHELNGALDAMGKFAAVAREAIGEYGEHARLSANTAGINIERLSKSFQGLITEHDLLSFASKTSRGALKLTQAEMERVGQAAIALRNRGFDLNEAVKRLTDSMVEGKSKGLDNFGLSIADADTKAGRLKNIMGELDRVIKESGSTTTDYADDVQRLAIEWDNTAAAAKRYTVEILKQVSVNDLMKKAHDKFAMEGQDANGFFRRAYAAKEAEFSQQQGQRNFQAGIKTGQQNILDRDKLDPDKAKAASEKAAAAAVKYAEEIRKLGDALLGMESASARAIRVNEVLRAGWEAEVALMSQLESDYTLAGQKRYNAEMEQLNRLLAEGKLSWDAYGHARQKAFEQAGGSGVASSNFNSTGVDFNATKAALAQTGSIVAQMQEDLRAKAEAKSTGKSNAREQALFGPHALFGEPQEWDEYIGIFEKTGDALNAFTNAIGAGYEAVVTGQGSVTAAIKKTLADGLMATGKSSVIEAIKHTAMGFGALASYQYPSAALHFKAAAVHGAVAVAAGLGANALGTSAERAASDKAASDKAQADLAGGKGAGGGGQSGSGSSRDASRPIYVILGDHFDDYSMRQRQQKVDEQVSKAMRERDE